MPSLIPGYEYDIFISYRQKDNKYDGWVTEFVDNLKKELEATFKEDISVYFDNNPHDGLHETHDVEASLNNKLKCIVFIPIISRTYCDPKSYAWEHEFKTFIKQASVDQFGLKIRIPGGNTANRILPVQIHELNPEDNKLIESELGGFIRGIEFIYRETGVNRPLRANEDHPNDNLNKTFYRNQLNKVANAICDVIDGLKLPVTDRTNDSVPEAEKPGRPINHKMRIVIGSLILLGLCLTLIFILPKFKKSKAPPERSIAVLPFINDSPSDSTTYFINGIMEEVLNNLQKIKDFRVLSRTSTDQYKDKTRPTVPEIANKLKVNYLVEGSGQKFGNKFVLRVQLIAANNERHLWGKSYDREIRQTGDIIDIQSEIAQLIAAELRATITPEQKQFIEKSPTTSLTAYDFYQRGREQVSKYEMDNSKYKFLAEAENYFKTALHYDSTFARAYTGLAMVYGFKHYNDQYYATNFLDSFLILTNKALSIDNNLAEAHYNKAMYFWQIGKIESVRRELDIALKLNPNYWEVYEFRGNGLYTWNYDSQDYIKGIENYQKAISLNHGKEMAGLLRGLGIVLDVNAGFHDLAVNYYKEAYELDNDSAAYYTSLATNEEDQGNYLKSLEYRLKSYSIDNENINVIYSLGYDLALLGRFKESLIYITKYSGWYKKVKPAMGGAAHRVGYCYWKNGNEKEAKWWFEEEKRYCESSIKNNRMYASLGLASYYDLACVYAFRGDKIKAYENLDELKKLKVFPKWWLTLIKNDPLLDNLRSDKEFQDMVNDLEAKYNAEHERVGKWLTEQNML